MLAGEPGIGKSRLAIELAREAHARGRDGALRALGPRVARALPAVRHRRPARDGAPRERRAAGRAGARAVRARAARPGPAPAPAELREPIAEDPETRRYRLFEAVTRLLAFLARERPTVLILDDLQWADTSTALLLGHLLRDVEDDAAARARHLPRRRRRPLPGAARAAGPARPRAVFERIELAGLDASETGDLVASYAERASDSFVAAPARGHRGQPVLRQGDDAQPRRRRGPRARARAA